jgi:Topoisomerase 6 subunit A/Spo11, Toprim domain
LVASADGHLPANARQVMYAARPEVLRLTAKQSLNDHYFTQVLLPDYIEAHPERTADWDVVFDDRGTFIEPHTGRVVPLGTLEVRQYLGRRSASELPARIHGGLLSATIGPHNRYGDILFIEKEGFSALLAEAQIARRFDLAIMSTKGMSVTAARMLLDELAPHIERVFVLHDFDVSGFSIFGTLGSDSRRYRFANIVPIIDLGLRLDDVLEMGLQSEPVTVAGDWQKRIDTLVGHGADDDEIDFLEHERVELNAMPSDMFVAFLERRLREYGVQKIVPADAELERHARRAITQALLNAALDEIRPKVEAQALRIELPSDLRQCVVAWLRDHPAEPWDLAISDIAEQALGENHGAP